MTKRQRKNQDSDRAEKVEKPKPTKQSSSRLKALAIITGVMGFILFCLTPILPVKQIEAKYSWPQGGDLTSVTSPLMSYMPQQLDITLPIEQARDLNPGETTILSTVPEGTEEATLRGLFVRATEDGMDVIVGNVVPLSLTNEQLDNLPDDATLRITSDHLATRVWVPDETDENGMPLDGALGGDFRPMLTGIYSEMTNTPENAKAAKDAGMDVSVKVDSRFTSSPTVLKSLAMLLGLIMTGIALWALHRIDKLDGRKGRRILPRKWWKPRPIDGVVGAFLGIWYIFGANTADDGYILTMARVSEHSGYMANYYRWFGVPESPIGFPFYDLLALMTKVSTASTWVRLPGLIAGIITWLILSREVLPRLGAKVNQRRVAHWTMAAMFLLFWMTYNNGTRPEPIIALASLLAWVSFERAIATHRLLPAAIGTIIATLALGAGPTGLMAVAALLVSLSSLIRIAIRRMPLLGARPGSSKGAITVAMLAQIAPFLAAGTAILVGVFGDQTLRSVIEATSVRGEVGPSIPWYEEYLRYTALLESSADGSFPRRYTILMLLFGFGVVIASTLRHGRVPGASKGPSTRLMLVILGTMFFMVFTPTKWTHHFGVYAGVGAALIGLAAVAASHFALSSRRNRIIFIGETLMLFALALAGTNGWWYISSFGVPWWDKTIQIAGIEASTVMLVISLLVLLWGVLVGYSADIRDARASSTDEPGNKELKDTRQVVKYQGLAAAPIGVLTALVVVFSVASLGKGFVEQWPAYSVGKGNLKALAGNKCAMANDVMVETDTNESFLKVADGSPLKNALVSKESHGFKPNNIPTKIDPGSTDASSASGKTSVTSQKASDTSGAGSAGAGSQGAGSQGAGSQGGAAGDGSQGAGSAGDAAGSQGGSAGTSATGAAGAGSQGGSSGSGADSSGSSSRSESPDSGTTGGVNDRAGVNGSYAKLPFFLDNQKTPVVGSFTEGAQVPARTTSKWFEIPELNEDRPLITFSAAGEMAYHDMNGVYQYGQDLKVEFGRSTGGDEMEPMGEFVPLDIGTAPEWRNMRIPKEVIPEGANVIRIVARDLNLTPEQWLAFTPPRAPQLKSLNEVIGSEAPGLLDWTAAFQFPCQRTYDHWAGVAEVPEFRISPDHSARRAHTPVMDYSGGGAAGLTEMTVNATELPTYLRGDWQRDWGVLDRLEVPHSGTGEAPKPAEIEENVTTRLGTYYPGPMKLTVTE